MDKLETVKAMYDFIAKAGNIKLIGMNRGNVCTQLNGKSKLYKPTEDKIREVFNISVQMERARLNAIIDASRKQIEAIEEKEKLLLAIPV